MAGKIQESLATRETAAPAAAAKKSVGALLNAMLDGEGYRKRFDELLGSRAPQLPGSSPEEYYVYHRDVLHCSHPAHGNAVKPAPSKK